MLISNLRYSNICLIAIQNTQSQMKGFLIIFTLYHGPDDGLYDWTHKKRCLSKL